MGLANHSMDDWFSAIASASELPGDAGRELCENGFAVIPGPVVGLKLAQLSAAYDAAVSGADPADVAIGSSTTRVNDFVNRGPEFDALYVHPPVLEACCRIIGQPFKLSTMHARSVHPNSPAQALHVDFQREGDGWPMVGFIFMVDEFRGDNGATRFVPGSHAWPVSPEGANTEPSDRDEKQIAACGRAGSVIVYNGSTRHGHFANRTAQARRSIQGAFIRRDAPAAVNQAARIRQETLGRISPLARYLLDI